MSESGDWLEREASRQGYVRVDTMRGKSGCSTVDAAVDGHGIRMILDTGASCTILDASSVGNLGLIPVPEERQATGVGGAARTQAVEVGSFRLGPRSLGARRMGVVDLGAVNDRLAAIGDERVQGVLGVDVLRAERALVDVRGGALYVVGDG